jgi:hypothetical protein
LLTAICWNGEWKIAGKVGIAVLSWKVLEYTNTVSFWIQIHVHKKIKRVK